MSTDPASPTPDPVEEAIFHAASDLNEPGTRAAFLDRACGADSALRSRIELLLASDLRARQFLAADPLDLDSKTRPKPVITSPEQSAGERIGRYKLLEKIGEGGMGVVYMAEQREPVVRKVALKIIKPGMDTRLVNARFEAERQALALMDHPNIARVLDGGVTENSRPYFVMDLVQGVPITQFCDERNLSTAARLDLFQEVCAAIQHAHQKGIIHRDIKPTNILVTLHGDKPVPKVIDFGVAKATQQRLTEKTFFTQFQHFIGTPAYMSPEQASLSGLDIDTRSDIYGLGVLLYELLTGKTPFDAKELVEAGLDAMRRTILEKEPVRPSTRLNALQRDELTTTAKRRQTDVPKLLHQLRGDLDWIVMKCLEKDRNRRYETANGLAADIQRHLSNEPVTARPPSRLYLFQKTVRRHRVVFVTGAAVLLTLAGGVALSSWQAVKAKRAERDARAVKDFLIEELLAMNLHMGSVADPNRQQLLERIAKVVGSRFVNQPLMEAEVRIALAEGFLGVENTFLMIEQNEKALAIRRRLLPPNHSDTLLAMAYTAQAYDDHGRARDAEKLLTEALALVESRPRPRTIGEAEVLFTRGAMLVKADRPLEGLKFMERAMPVVEIQADPKSYRFQSKLIWIIRANTFAGRFNEAEVLVNAGIQQAERYFGPEHPAVAQFLSQRSIWLYRKGRFLESANVREQVLAISQRTVGPNVKRTIDAEYEMAHAFEHAGEVERARQGYTNVYRRLARFLPNQPHRFFFHNMGVFFASHRDFETATAVFGFLRDSYDAKPPEQSVNFDYLIEATAPTKGWAAVTKVYRTYPGRFERDATYQRNMASALLYGNDLEGYRQTVTNAMARALTETNIDEQRRFVDIAGLGRVEFSSEEISRCEKLLSLAGTNVTWHRPIAALLLRLGRYEGAIQRLDVALEKKPSTTERARLLMLKAICLNRSGDLGKARTAFDEAEALMKDRLLARLPKEEGFINHDERAYLIHRSEAQAVLTEKSPN